MTMIMTILIMRTKIMTKMMLMLLVTTTKTVVVIVIVMVTKTKTKDNDDEFLVTFKIDNFSITNIYMYTIIKTLGQKPYAMAQSKHFCTKCTKKGDKSCHGMISVYRKICAKWQCKHIHKYLHHFEGI